MADSVPQTNGSAPAAPDRGIVAYPTLVPDAPLPFDLKALLVMALGLAALHLMRAAVFAGQFVGQRNVSWFVNFWGWYYIVSAALRAILPSLLMAGVIGIWTRKAFGRRCTVWSIRALVLFGLAEAVVSLYSFMIGPPRRDEAAGVAMSITETFLTRYAILLLPLYGLKRHGDAAAMRTTEGAGEAPPPEET